MVRETWRKKSRKIGERDTRKRRNWARKRWESEWEEVKEKDPEIKPSDSMNNNILCISSNFFSPSIFFLLRPSLPLTEISKCTQSVKLFSSTKWLGNIRSTNEGGDSNLNRIRLKSKLIKIYFGRYQILFFTFIFICFL